jgi:hypothetical protein
VESELDADFAYFFMPRVSEISSELAAARPPLLLHRWPHLFCVSPLSCRTLPAAEKPSRLVGVSSRDFSSSISKNMRVSLLIANIEH